MITLKGKNLDIQLNGDGSYSIDGKHYFAKNKDKLLHKKLFLFLKNKGLKQELDYNKLPLFYANKIYKDLYEIKDDNYLNKEDKKLFEKKLTRFGFEFDTGITRLEEKYLNLLFKAGYSKLDYNKNKMKKVNDILFSKEDKIKNNEFLQTFLTNFKKSKSNDYTLFSETVQELANYDEKEVFRLYNDEIDEHFVLDSEEYRFIYGAKKRLIEQQQKIIENAIKYDIEVPIELPRFIAPSNKFKDVILNPEKAKMIARFDFEQYDKNYSYESKNFNNDGVKEEQKDILSHRMKNGLKKINLDLGNNTEFVTAQILKNGGFYYNKFKEWAIGSSDNGILNVDDAFQAINNGLLHCNRLVEAGILKCTGDGTFKFTSDRCRDILFNYPDDNYIELSNKVIKAYDISFDSVQKMKENKTALVETQKKDFFTYLDAQYESYYKIQDKSVNDFLKDVYHVKHNLPDGSPIEERYNSEEFNYCKNLCPELFHNINKFSDIIEEYKKEKEYYYVRDTNYDFSKNVKTVKETFKTIQKENAKIKDENNPIKVQFKDIAALNFDGVNLEKLERHKEYSVQNGRKEKDINIFIENSINRAEELTNIGILKKVKEGDYQFVDDYARKVLFQNIGADLNTLKIANRGVKTKITNNQEKKQEKQNKKQENPKFNSQDLINKFEKFNFNYRYSRNKVVKIKQKDKEDEIKKDLLAAYHNGDKKIIDYFDKHDFSEKDNKYRKKIVKEIKDTDLNSEVKKIAANSKINLELK